MAKMNVQQFLASLEASDLKLISFEKNANGRLTKATDANGIEHVVYTNNLKNAVQKGIVVPDEDGHLVVPGDHANMTDEGITLITYGGGLDLSKEKFE